MGGVTEDSVGQIEKIPRHLPQPVAVNDESVAITDRLYNEMTLSRRPSEKRWMDRWGGIVAVAAGAGLLGLFASRMRKFAGGPR